MPHGKKAAAHYSVIVNKKMTFLSFLAS